MRTFRFAFAVPLLLSGTLAADLPDYGGTWETTYGTMALYQEGSAVNGYYTLGGYSTVRGEVDRAGRLVFTYTEPSATGRGWFLLSEDGNRIRGMWKPDGGDVWYEWEGYRAGIGMESSRWLVILESEWQESLIESEYSFGEMLAAWFARVPGVTVRHRFIHGAEDLVRFCLESSGLPGDLYLVIASHGTSSGIELASGTVSSRDFLRAIEPCRNLAMLHFSCCGIMSGGLPGGIIGSRNDWPEGFAVSGYTESVDWSASGVIEIFYLNRVLETGLSPSEAARSVIDEIAFAGSRASGRMDPAGFTWLEPER